MIFTFNGQNTYIFDLDRTGKALVLNQGVVDLGEASSPQCLAILRLEDNAVVMDIQATADNGEFHLVTEDDRQSFILDDGDTVDISGNQLHISLHRNDDGDLLGGEFILENFKENNGEASGEPSGEKSNSDTSDTGMKHKSGGLFETLIYSSQPDTPSKAGNSDTPVPPKPDNDEELSETLVVDENLSETQVIDENLSETQVVEENLSETRVPTENLSEARSSVDDLSETRMSVEDLSETRISLEDLSETKIDGGADKSTGAPQVAEENASERLSGETSLIESTFFSVDVVNKLSEKEKKKSDADERKIRLLKIGDGIKEDSSTGEFDYHVKKYVGQGGFGQVYKIEDKYKNPFALKVLLPKVLEKSNFALSLFDQEVGIARFLEYSGLVKALEHYYDSKRDLHYCIMTYIDGVSFTDVIDYYADRHTSMHYMFATLVVLKVAEALDYLSEHGVVHRDIKPQNVMLTRDGEVKVLDLGISRRDFNTQPLADNEVLGTLPYVPLGQFLHQDPVDVRVDIYSLGVMYFGLLTCDHPYSIPSRKLPRAERIEQLAKELFKSYEKPSLTPNPRAKNKNVPERVAKVVMKMMAQDVRRRYKTADDLIHDLERITGTLTAKEVKRELSNLCDAVKNKKPVPVPTAGIRNRITSERRGGWMRPLAWIAAIIVILGLAVMFALSQKRTDDFHKDYKQLKNQYKMVKDEHAKLKNLLSQKSLNNMSLILSRLEKDGDGILDNPSWDAKNKMTMLKTNIDEIQAFDTAVKKLVTHVKLTSNSDEWTEDPWVTDTDEWWPEQLQKQFWEIKEGFMNLREEMDKRTRQAVENLKNTDKVSKNIQFWLKEGETNRRNLERLVADAALIAINREGVLQKQDSDEAGKDLEETIKDVEAKSKGYENWLKWCTDLWKVQDDLKNIDLQKADNVLKNADEKINELKMILESFGGFKDDFNVALDQVCKKKQEMDVIRKVDSQYEKINAIVSEIGANMPSEEQLKQIRSICDNAGEIIKDNAELANKLASCKEKYKKINEVRQMLETLDNLDKRHQEFIRNMMDMKKLGDAGNVAAAEKNLEDIKEIFEKDRNKIIKLSETMKTVKFSHQKDDLAQKWNELIQEANGIVNNANMQIVKKDKILLQQESEELEDLVKSCSDYIVQMVSWNWSIERKEMDIQKLRTHKSDADRLLDNMKQRKTDDKAKTLQEKGQKNHDVIKDRVQAVEKGLLPILERFYNIKKELTDDNNEISQFEARAKMGSLQKDNMVNGIKETINELKRRNNTQFEAIAKLKDWSDKPTYLPIVAIENLKGICGQLKKLQEDNGIKLRNFEKIWKSVVEFSQKMNELSWKVEELEELSKKIVNTKDVSRKEEVIDLYSQVNTMAVNMKNEVNQIRNSIGAARIQAIDKEVAKARSAWENCQKIFNQMEAFEKGMEELNLLLKRLKDEIRKLKLNISDFEKVEVAYKAFMDQSENTIIVFGVIPGKKIEEKKQLVANAKDMYESYEKIKKEKKREYETVKKEFDNVMGHLKKINEKLENGEKVVFKDLGKAYYDVMEKYKQLSAIPGDKEIKKEQELLTKEQWPEAERLYRKSLKSLDFLEYNENYSSLQRELGKRKWGLRVSEVKIQEKIKTCRGLAEALLQDEGLSLEKRKFLEDNLKELQKLEKK